METTYNCVSLIDKLLSGEVVECVECHKGHYRPLNPDFKVNHCFVCDSCGGGVHCDPVVKIE